MECIKCVLQNKQIPYQEGEKDGNVYVDIPSLNATVGLWAGCIVSCPLVGNPWDLTFYHNHAYSQTAFASRIIEKLENNAKVLSVPAE